MSKISKASQCICTLLITIASLQVITHLVLIFFSKFESGSEPLTANFTFYFSNLSHQITYSWQNIAQALENEGFNALVILSTVQLIPYLLIYFFLYKLFKLYQQGKIFTTENSNCFKNIGKTLFAWIAINLLYPIIVTLSLRLTGLSDSLALYFSFGSKEFIYLLSGLIIYVMAWVMREAHELHQEQELVI